METAKLTPILLSPVEAKIADIMPTRRPSASTSAPPETPGFDAASVWTKSSTGLNPALVTFSADTTPQVTERPRPKALPMAQTGCAGRGGGAIRKGARAASTPRTAMSLAASLAISRAGRMRPVGEANVDPPGRLDHVPGRRDDPGPQHHAASFRRDAGRSAAAALGPPGPHRQHRHHRFQRLRGKRRCRSRLGREERERQRGRPPDPPPPHAGRLPRRAAPPTSRFPGPRRPPPCSSAARRGAASCSSP